MKIGEQTLPQPPYLCRENAPMARFRGLVVARWPQPGGTAPGFEIQLYLVLDFSLQLLILTKRSLICWLQPLDLGGFISTSFQPL